MRGFQSGLLAALTCGVLLLAACGGGETSGDAAWTKEDAQKILDSAAFSEELEELDLDTAWMLYGLGDAGLERESLTDGVCRRSAGATCEELTVLIFDSAQTAEAALDALDGYLEGQIASNTDYRPAEIPKLEGAWVEQRENTVLMAVADDMDAAKAAVEA